MKMNSKRLTIYDGPVTEILRGANSVQVEINNGRYEHGQGYVTEPTTVRLDNPAQAEGLEVGQKVAIFKSADGKTNLVREGQWKASESIPVPTKKDPSRTFDQGVTVIMGTCYGVRLIKPKEGQTFEPFLALNVVTSDHVRHNISIKNREPYSTDAIERAMDRFKDYMANDKHEFIPFTGTFVTNMSYRQEELDVERNGRTYHNVDRSYGDLIVTGSYQDYEKAPERSKSQAVAQEQAQTQVQEQAQTSLDTNVELGNDDGFAPVSDLDEEMPFD